MKKIFSKLIVGSAIVAPIAILVSCGDSNTTINGADNKGAKHNKNIKHDENVNHAENKIPNIKTKPNDIFMDILKNKRNPSELKKNEFYDVKRDSFYLLDDFYKGTIYKDVNANEAFKKQVSIHQKFDEKYVQDANAYKNNDQWKTDFSRGKKEAALEERKLSKPSLDISAKNTNSTTMIAPGDSIILAFDKDEKDGISSKTIQNSLKLVDYSVINDQNIIEENKKIKQFQSGKGIVASFAGDSEKGGLLPYYGSNTPWTFDDLNYEMDKLKAQSFSSKILSAYDDYFTFGEGASKTYNEISDPSSSPIEVKKNSITYERVAKNIYKITFHEGIANPNLRLAVVSSDAKYDFVKMKPSTGQIIQTAPLSIGNKYTWNKARFNDEKVNGYKFFYSHGRQLTFDGINRFDKAHNFINNNVPISEFYQSSQVMGGKKLHLLKNSKTWNDIQAMITNDNQFALIIILPNVEPTKEHPTTKEDLTANVTVKAIIVDNAYNRKVWQYIWNDSFQMNFVNHKKFGSFLLDAWDGKKLLSPFDNVSRTENGKVFKINRAPFIYNNANFAQFGVSSLRIKKRAMIEFTYGHDLVPNQSVMFGWNEKDRVVAPKQIYSKIK